MNAVKRGRFISPTKNAELLLFNRIQTVKYLRVYGIYLVKGWPQLLKSSNYTYKTAATPFFIVLELSVTQLQNSTLYLPIQISCPVLLSTGPTLFWTFCKDFELEQNHLDMDHKPKSSYYSEKSILIFDIDQNYLDQPKIFLTLGSSCVPSVATLFVYFPTNNICHHQKTVKCQRNSL